MNTVVFHKHRHSTPLGGLKHGHTSCPLPCHNTGGGSRKRDITYNNNSLANNTYMNWLKHKQTHTHTHARARARHTHTHARTHTHTTLLSAYTLVRCTRSHQLWAIRNSTPAEMDVPTNFGDSCSLSHLHRKWQAGVSHSREGLVQLSARDALHFQQPAFPQLRDGAYSKTFPEIISSQIVAVFL